MRGKGFADLHHHLLWGMDDGPKTPEQMHAMLRRAVRDGITSLAATSHAYPGARPFDMDKYLSRLDEARQYCRQQGWELQLLRGCEIHYCDSVPDLLMAGKLPTLGETRMVLIEFDSRADAAEICRASNKLYRVGYQPIVAHVERCRSLLRSPRAAMEIREECGLFYQMNCSTVLEPRGIRERSFVRRMLDAQAIDLVATDAHDTAGRAACMKETYRALLDRCESGYARRLVRFGQMRRGDEETKRG